MICVRTSEGNAGWFRVTSVVRQGCAFSPLLHIVIMNKITQEATDNPNNAEDQDLIHPSQESLKKHATRLNETCKKLGAKMSTV